MEGPHPILALGLLCASLSTHPQPLGGLGLCVLTGELERGYKGNGEVGSGRGELVVVLGRWFGLETVGK
ncbi:hypothetical protein Tco_0443944 [Tanacetum coccineum]